MNIADKEGLTPLYFICRDGNFDLAKKIVEAGAKPHVKDENGLTPLYFLCQAGYNNLAKMFIDHGADVDSAGCLQVALDNYLNDVAETLIELGCDVNKVRVFA